MLREKIHKGEVQIFFVIFIAALARLFPHPPNLSAFMGASLFALSFRNNFWQNISFIFLALILSDSLLGYYYVWPAVYLSYFLIFSAAHRAFQKRFTSKIKGVSRTFGVVLGSSLGFYILTNLAEWWASPFYPKTAAALALSYKLGLPFFRNALLSDLATFAILVAASWALRLRAIKKASLASH